MRRVLIALCVTLGLLCSLQLVAEDRDKKVRDDKAVVQKAGRWVYDDMEQGIALAKKTGKPLMIVFR